MTIAWAVLLGGALGLAVSLCCLRCLDRAREEQREAEFIKDNQDLLAGWDKS